MATAKPVIFLKLLGDSAQYLLWLDVPPALQAKYAGDQTDSPYELISAAELAAIVAGEVNQSLVNIPMRVTAGGTSIDGQAMWDAAVEIRRLRQDNLNAQGNLLTENAYWDGVQVVLPEEDPGPGPVTPPAIQSVSVSNITQTTATINWSADQPVVAKAQYGLTNFGTETALGTVPAVTGSISLSGLTANSTYQARVYIQNAEGLNATSTSFPIVTPAVALAFTGTGPQLSALQQTTATLTAGSTVSATMTALFVPVNAVFGGPPTLSFGPTASGTTHTLSLTGLTANTAYDWSATLSDGTNNIKSATFRITTLQTPPVDPPPPVDAWVQLLGDLDGNIYRLSEETEPMNISLVTLLRDEFMRRAASPVIGIDLFNPTITNFDYNHVRQIVLSGGGGDDAIAHMYWMYEATGDVNFLDAARRVGEMAVLDPKWQSAGYPNDNPGPWGWFYAAPASFGLLSLDHPDATVRQLARGIVQNYAYNACKNRGGDILDNREAAHELEWMTVAHIIGLTTISSFVPGTGGVAPTPPERNMEAMAKRKVDFMLDNQAANLTHKAVTISDNSRGFQSGGWWYQKEDGSGAGIQPSQFFNANLVDNSKVVTWTGGASSFASIAPGRRIRTVTDNLGISKTLGARVYANWVPQVTTTSGSPVLTRGAGNSFGSFVHADMIGRKLTGPTDGPIPAGAVVTAVNTTNQTITIDMNATATSTARVQVTVLAKDPATNTFVIDVAATENGTGVAIEVGGILSTQRKHFMDGCAARALAFYARTFPADKARIIATFKAMYGGETPGPKGWYQKFTDGEGGPLDYSNVSTTNSPTYSYILDGEGNNYAPEGSRSHYCSENGFHLVPLAYLAKEDPAEFDACHALATLLIQGIVSQESSGRPTGGGGRELQVVWWKPWNGIMDGVRFLPAFRDAAPPVQDIVFDAVAQFATVQGANGWSYLEGSTNTPMNWDAVDGRWEGALAFQNIRTSGGTTLLMHPGSTRGAKLRFTVPEDGAMRISLAAWDADPAGGDGVRVIVTKTGMTLQNIGISNGQTIVTTYNPDAFAVVAGDTIDLEVTAGSGTNNSSDTTGLLYSLILTPGGSAPPALSVTATVAVGTTEVAVHTKAVGFLSGITASGPADALITPLAPKLHRGVQNSASLYNRITSLGMVSQHYMAAGWPAYASANGLPPGTYPGDGGLNWNIWEAYVASVVNAEIAAGRSHQYDVWNEPNVSQFWPPTATRNAAQFNELWKRAYNVIKGINSGLVVEGPNVSLDSSTDRTYLTNFLSFCKANSCIPDVLSWHEIPSAGPSTPWTLKTNVDLIKSFMTAQSITHPPISINEYGGSDLIENKPGVVLTYLAQIEDCGTSIASAAKACWPTSDTGTTQSCGQPTLGGYLTLTNGQRAGWRIIAAYAALTGTFVSVTADHDILYGSAAVSGSTIVALLGNPRGNSYGDRVVRFTGLSNGAKTVTRERLSQGTGTQDWVSLGSFGATVSDTTLAVTLPAVGAYEAFRITITP